MTLPELRQKLQVVELVFITHIFVSYFLLTDHIAL